MVLQNDNIRLCLLFAITISPVTILAATEPFDAVLPTRSLSRTFTWPRVATRLPTDLTLNQRLSFSSIMPCSNRYSIGEEMFDGLSATVHKARDNNSGNKVIIKVFKDIPTFIREEFAFSLLSKRIQILEATRPYPQAEGSDTNTEQSPWRHFVRVLHRCKKLDDMALVIESLEQDLLDVINLDLDVPIGSSQSLYTPPSASKFTGYAYQLVKAVEVLQQMGILHLDLKPENIGLTRDGTLKLFDFVVLCTIQPTYFVGTYEYSAPEKFLPLQIKQGNKMDIWSVGCTIYEMFTVDRLFDDIEAFVKHIKKPNAAACCDNTAFYFYIIWSIGGTTSSKYEEHESNGREDCPQIFSETAKQYLLKHKPRLHDYAFSRNGLSVDSPTEIQFKFNEILSDQWIVETRIKPSGSHLNDLVNLLTDLLKLDYEQRISAHTALTQYRIFETYRLAM